MDNNTVEIEQEQVDTIIKRGEALKRLYANPDFKEVILDGYLKDEVLRLVALKGDLSFLNNSPERARFLENRLQSAAEFQAFLRENAMQYAQMVNALNEQAELDAEDGMDY